MTDSVHAEVLGDLVAFTLRDLCQVFDENFVLQCVEHGIAPVTVQAGAEWMFPATSVLRIRKAWRLHHDLDLHLGSLPLVLELIDERDHLYREVIALRKRLGQWERD
ncbi:MAG: hypothetical protein RLZZ227_1307 [Pseudomonadota bacterium]|jgi:chaperone modulatory protein CbpM